MKRALAAAAALLLIFVGAQPATAANLLTNAGFESGSLAGGRAPAGPW